MIDPSFPSSARGAGVMSTSALLADIGQLSILCVGDVMIDKSVKCQVKQASPEAPVLVVHEGAHSYTAGGAANVAANLAGMGVSVTLAGVIGRDTDGKNLTQKILDAGVIDALQRGPMTTRKTRFVAQGQQILRLDRDAITAPDEPILAQLCKALDDWAAPINALLISDYGKGVLSEAVLAACHAAAARQKALIFVDPKGSDWDRYGTVDVLKPNLQELAYFTRCDCHDDDEVEKALQIAFTMCQARAIVVTRAEAGATVALRNGGFHHIRAASVEVSDVCGAGDTNLAALAAALAVGADWTDACDFAQLASSIVVQRQGTAVVDSVSLMAAAQQNTALPNKLIDVEHLTSYVKHWQQSGLKVAFTNGCFDVIHAGHVSLLTKIKQHCDRLIVGLNSDSSIRNLKGSDRPIHSLADRVRVLSAFDVVDAIIVFDDPTPIDLITTLRPDILAKGGDYSAQNIVGSEFVSNYGGKILIIPLYEGFSSSSIIEKLRKF